MSNTIINFREYVGRPKYLSIVFFVLGISGAAFALMGIIFYLRYGSTAKRLVTLVKTEII
jgi:hypothetical protein